MTTQRWRSLPTDDVGTAKRAAIQLRDDFGLAHPSASANMLYPTQSSSYVLTLILLYLITHVSALFIYRLYFHPLAKYPGPFLGKITSLYAAYHGYIRDVHIDVQTCHEKYGDFVRYGPNKLLVNSASGVHDIYGHKSNVKKAQFYSQFHRGLLPSALSAYDKDDHAPRRKVLNPSFSEVALKQYDITIAKHADIFIDKMVEENSSSSSSYWSVGRNMALWCMHPVPRRPTGFDCFTDYLHRRLSRI
jgi:hypothetical protein